MRDILNIDIGKQLNKKLLLSFGPYAVWNGGKDHSGFWNEFNREENTISISQGGESAGYVQWQCEKFWAGAHCYTISNIDNKKIIDKYLYYLLKNNEDKFMQSQYGAGIPALSKSFLLEMEFTIPPLEVQNKIVKILDKFSSIIKDFKNGIPKEIELIKKQYEYYRNKLLNFEGITNDQ